MYLKPPGWRSYLGTYNKSVVRLHLKLNQLVKRISTAETYLKWDLQCVLFTDACRATADGPDNWWRGYNAWSIFICFRQGLMAISLSPRLAADGVKINTLVMFLRITFHPWLKKKDFRISNEKWYFVAWQYNPASLIYVSVEYLAKLALRQMDNLYSNMFARS